MEREREEMIKDKASTDERSFFEFFFFSLTIEIYGRRKKKNLLGHLGGRIMNESLFTGLYGLYQEGGIFTYQRRMGPE